MAHSELMVVTGGAGFIGSHTVGRLLDEGHRVVVLDDFSSGKKQNLRAWDGHAHLTVVETDICDGIWGALAPVVQTQGPVDRIIHLAAQTSVIKSIDNPLDDVRMNYSTTVHVLEYARHNKVKKVSFASSAAVYGDIAELPVREDMPPRPVSPYGCDKLGSENFLHYYAQVHGVQTTALRFFNVYGPRQDPFSPYSGVISIFFARAMANQKIVIFGDGEQTRDFVFVQDVAQALVTATFSDKGNGDFFNVGTERKVSVNELAQLVVKVTGSSSAIEHGPSRAGEILHSLSSVKKAREAFGFSAKVAVDEGLAATCAWFKEQAGK